MELRQVAAGIAAATMLAGAASVPIIPQEMKWLVSYDTFLFDTDNGDLSIDQYAVDKDGITYYYRESDKDVDNFEATTSPDVAIGRTLVAIKAENGAYYDEFWDGTAIVRVQSNHENFDSMLHIPYYPQPKNTKRISSIEAFISVAEAAIGFDSDSEVAVDPGSALTVSWSHTTGSGSERFVVVGGSCFDATNSDTVFTSATYNGSSITVDGSTNNAGQTISAGIAYATAPATGTFTVAVTFGGTCTDPAAGSMSLSGVDQTTPIDANNGNTGNTEDPACTVDAITNNNFVYSYIRKRTSNITGFDCTSPATLLSALDNGNTFGAGCYDGSGSAGTRTITFNDDSTSGWACRTVAIKPSAGGGGGGGSPTPHADLFFIQ